MANLSRTDLSQVDAVADELSAAQWAAKRLPPGRDVDRLHQAIEDALAWADAVASRGQNQRTLG